MFHDSSQQTKNQNGSKDSKFKKLLTLLRKNFRRYQTNNDHVLNDSKEECGTHLHIRSGRLALTREAAKTWISIETSVYKFETEIENFFCKRKNFQTITWANVTGMLPTDVTRDMTVSWKCIINSKTSRDSSPRRGMNSLYQLKEAYLNFAEVSK